jgi:hypothetical protein
MFQPSTANFSSSIASFAGLSTSLSSALAYSVELRDANITVVDDCGVIVLEGEAPLACLARISDIAASIVGSRFCNLIRPI